MLSLKFQNFRSRKNSVIPKERYVQDSIDDDCWEMIFNLIKEEDPQEFVSMSLVCKRFLSVTNRMKTSLTVSDLTVCHLPKALQRFQNIRSICIDTSFHKDVDSLVSQISQSMLQHLESLELLYSEKFPREGLYQLGMSTNGLKKLKCVGTSLYDDDLILLSDLFPCLEEICLDCCKTYELVTDHGVEVLASKLKKLKKVTLSDCSYITDQAITCLSKNCKNLTSLEIQYCEHVTENGIGFVIRHSSKLTSLTLVLSCEQSFLNNESQFSMENSISYARNLEEIQFWGMVLSDDLICSIAKSCTMLKKIDLDPRLKPCNVSMLGLGTMTKGCLALKSLSPQAFPLSDEYMLDLCENLRGLTHINLRNCSTLTSVTFFILTQRCPFLESVIMDGTRVGSFEDVDVDLHQNYQIKYLSLKSCNLLNDTSLLIFARLCPYLESLDISDCKGNFTNEGIAESLGACPNIRHLNVGGLQVSNFLGSDNSKLNLNTIKADGTQINDEALEVIAERCPDLEELNIGFCDQITEEGVKLLVTKCEKLKKIDMQRCNIWPMDLMDWMLVTKHSLKEIVPPRRFIPSEERRSLFLANGCLLLNGVQLWEGMV